MPPTLVTTRHVAGSIGASAADAASAPRITAATMPNGNARRRLLHANTKRNATTGKRMASYALAISVVSGPPRKRMFSLPLPRLACAAFINAGSSAAAATAGATSTPRNTDRPTVALNASRLRIASNDARRSPHRSRA